MEKLLWEVIHKEKFNINDDYLEKILLSNGVKDTDEFLNPCIKHTFSPFTLNNMENGINLLKRNLGRKIYVKIDPDVDGMTSGAYIYQAIKEIDPDTEIIYGLNYKKEHGIIYDDVKDIEELSLIIVPDAGSGKESVEEYLKILKYKNVPILVIDHHEISKEILEIENVVIINCQDGSYENNNLSGVGVVHKFFEGFCEIYPEHSKILENYLDLVSLGIVADSMDMRSLENRFYVFKGMEDEYRKSEFINELCKKYEEDMKLGITMKAYGWTLAPKVNGVTRYGKEKEQLDLFRAFIGEQERIEYQPRRKNKTDPKPPIEIHTLQQTMARVAGNVKQRQDNDVRKFMTEIDALIKEQELENHPIIIIDGSDALKKKSVSGLVANKLTSKYKRPILILKQNKKDNSLLAGSARGYEKGDIQDFRAFLLSKGIFEYCEGHPNAFGVGIKKDRLEEAREKVNNGLKKPSTTTIYEVDYEIDANNLKNNAVVDVANSFKLWGKGVDEPTFAITNIQLPVHEIKVFGDNNGFIKFKYNGVDFVKKYCKKNEFEILTHAVRNTLGKDTRVLSIDIIGNFVFNIYDGNRYPQVKIDRFYSEIIEKESKNSKEQQKLINEMDVDDIF